MKQVTVKTVNSQYQVNLNNANEVNTLTPGMAKAARDIAAGVGANATVTDGQDTYRVTHSGVRRK